ncbi:MAG: hypothetical protein K8H88_06970 [Sandaracinaceae bacterium]|nr:hypothetical protein [Sandaracinaceae bacterium]
MTNNDNEGDEGHYVEFDECYQHGRRMRRRSTRIDLAAKNPAIRLADLLAVMRLAEHAKPNGRVLASELIARIGETAFEALPGSMRLVRYRVPTSGSLGLARTVSAEHATPDVGPDVPGRAETADTNDDG